MGATSAIVMGIGTLIGGGAAVYSATQQQKQAKSEEKRVEETKDRDIMLQQQEEDKLVGRQRAAFGASGVRVGSGTPLAVVESTRDEAAQEREAILKGYGYDVDRARREAGVYGTQAIAEGAGTLLTGVGQYAKSPYAKNPFAPS